DQDSGPSWYRVSTACLILSTDDDAQADRGANSPRDFVAQPEYKCPSLSCVCEEAFTTPKVGSIAPLLPWCSSEIHVFVSPPDHLPLAGISTQFASTGARGLV